jgi:hypothetical protein
MQKHTINKVFRALKKRWRKEGFPESFKGIVLTIGILDDADENESITLVGGELTTATVDKAIRTLRDDIAAIVARLSETVNTKPF